MEKYKLVIFGDTWDVYQIAHKDLIDNPLIVYISTFRPQGLLGVLQRIQFNPRLNRWLKMPFKACWNSYYLRGIKGRRLCFLVLENWLRMECGIRLLPYLRKYYPDARIVCFTQDLIETIKDHYSCRQIDMDYLKKYADLFISYDMADAKKHGVLYHPTVFSSLGQKGCMEEEKYDLYFLGRDKGRLNVLVRICEKAVRRGLRCKFLLIEVPVHKQVVCDGVTYLGKTLSYAENLRYCAESRCIVEMLQHDAASPTFRTWEAVMLNKKLLTNNAAIEKSSVYDKRYISVFHDEEDFDWAFVEGAAPFRGGGNPYQEVVKPESLIKFIEQELTIRIDR